MKVSNEEIRLPLLETKGVSLSIKREDTIHPLISGNKYRKLKYNLIRARAQEQTQLLTFGGAYSNHIAATAYAGKLHGFETIGVIRGEELKNKWSQNPTLRLAKEHGMRFYFVPREVYRLRNTKEFEAGLQKQYGDFYLLPEGGTNSLAIKGCEEILNDQDEGFDVICCCVGTGGTLAGLVNSSSRHQHVLGFSALKGDFLLNDIRKFARKDNWKLILDYHFGGYAKVNAELVHFSNDFKEKTAIQLEPIYTGKLFYGLLDLISKDFFDRGTSILAIHTGGLQGITGMNQLLKKKNLPLLNL
ncbi:pyridoxal-phosphate dependent enzyme [Croceitalea sp. MTPC5]|uniref:1-aminocyclopropane-1-carboxylate deaminase/D-cysteine desulfhydrase n=1 Tax=Croceitalea sp. MTPC5 TaxID=3056565 RepID=UPI002B389A15|nr:pyridoxal-phosphate dependent enzyme [Croceitalea sp. MTPC5]